MRLEVRLAVVDNTERSRTIVADSSNAPRLCNGHALGRPSISTANQGDDMPLDVNGRHVIQPRNRQAATATIEKILHWKGSRRKLTVICKVIATVDKPR